jgi:hypothetical protein
VIHFPNGQQPLPVAAPNLGADLVRALERVPSASQPAATPGDIVSVRSLPAALDLGLMNHQDPNSAPAGAADYQLARTAALASEPVTSLHHLGEAVQQSPAYASVALQDPAFNGMRDQVQDLANRMNPVGGTDQTAGAGTYQPPRGVLPAGVVTTDAPAVAERPVVTSLPQVVETGQDPAPNSANVLPAQTASAPASTIPAQPSATEVSRPPLPAPQPAATLAPPPHAPAAGPTAAQAVSAALDLELLHSWDTQSVRAAAANEYQLAQTAIQSGDRPAALQHLEQAILAHPAQAAAALVDPAFDSIKGQVRDLVTRLTLAARIHAEVSISEARAVLQSVGTSLMTRPLLMARAYLHAAQASFQLGTYTGYVQAAFAAELSQRVARGKLRSRRWSLGAFAPVKRAVEHAARRLWQRLPVLAILLGWFVAGIVAAVASLPFEAGTTFRGWLLPVWSIGLVCGVLYGFVRSIRAASRRRT